MEDMVIHEVINDAFYPKEYTLKFCVDILIRSLSKGGSRRGALGGNRGLLMGHLEDRVILDNMDDLGSSQGSYPESFVSLSLLLGEI